MEILELKNTESEIKNSTDGLNSRMERPRKESMNLKVKQQELPNLNREKMHWKKNEQHLRDPLDYKKGLTFVSLESQKKRRGLGS